MKRAAKISIVVIALAALVFVMQYHPTAGSNAAGVPLQAPAGNSPATPTTASSTPANYKDGTYTGDSVDVGYGIVEVQAIISGGKISDVKFLQLPNDRDHSVEVSNFSSPILKSETLQSQSANVDIVSGATSTSEGYMQSLQAALAKAQA